MTKDELIERALREAGVFPPSVMDSHYGDRQELTRAELIVRSLEEMGMLSLSEQDPLHGMRLVELPCCGWAWLCCAVDAASSPEPVLIIHERELESSEGKMRTGKPRNGGRRED